MNIVLHDSSNTVSVPLPKNLKIYRYIYNLCVYIGSFPKWPAISIYLIGKKRTKNSGKRYKTTKLTKQQYRDKALKRWANFPKKTTNFEFWGFLAGV